MSCSQWSRAGTTHQAVTDVVTVRGLGAAAAVQRGKEREVAIVDRNIEVRLTGHQGVNIAT